MSFIGTLLKAGIHTDGQNVNIFGGTILARNIIGSQGNVYYWDPNTGRGNDDNTGKSMSQAKLTLAAAEDVLTAGQNDVLVYLSGDTSGVIVDTLTWDKSYTHFVGLGAPVGVAQRTRLFNSGDSTSGNALLNVTANGCIFDNLYISQGSDTAECHAVEVSGERNYFHNIHMAGMGHATPAGGANSDSLFLNGGSENVFERCTIGLDTIKRTATNCQLRVDSGATRNYFNKCRMINWSESSAHVLIKYVDTLAADRWMEFEGCKFFNFWTNHGGILTELMDRDIGATCDVIFTGSLTLQGIDEIDAGDIAGTWVSTPIANAAGGVALKPIKA